MPRREAGVATNKDPSRHIFCQYHPVLGYDGIPGFNARWRDEYTIRLNSEGNRDVEHDPEKRPGVLRALVMGDSFACLYSSKDKARFTALLSSLFEGRSERYLSLEVINQAVSGYGSDQEVLKFLLEGEKYRPDVEIAAFFCGNDPLENSSHAYWDCPKPRFTPIAGELWLSGVPVKRLRGWANNRVVSPASALHKTFGWSRLFELVASRELPTRWLKPGPLAEELKALPFGEVRAERDRTPVEPMAVTLSIYEFLHAYRAERRIPLVVLVIPSAHLYARDDPREASFRTAMLEWLRSRDIPAVDYLERTAAYQDD